MGAANGDLSFMADFNGITRSRELAPIAVPLTWGELHDLDAPSRWHIGDGAEMLKRATSKNVAYWGRADQVLPDL
ncbi:hypothetical protein [Novosphingobium sp. ZW T3_23]|uniref:hypothetical protein n=1 Tax=Novosphingobium sp. ZW T3_23 TaxID=3378084 RepID=UPI003852B2C3